MNRILLSVVLCFAIVAPANAQDFLEHFSGALGGGAAFPAGTTNDHAGTGYNFIAMGGPRITPRFSLLVNFTLQDSMNVDLFRSGGTDTPIDANLRMWSITLDPVFDFVREERTSVYGVGGYGVYNRRLQLTRAELGTAVVCDPWWGFCANGLVVEQTPVADQSTYKGGFNLGGGFAFGLTTKFFVEVRYHHMFTTNESTQIVPVTVGFRW